MGTVVMALVGFGIRSADASRKWNWNMDTTWSMGIGGMDASAMGSILSADCATKAFESPSTFSAQGPPTDCGAAGEQQNFLFCMPSIFSMSCSARCCEWCDFKLDQELDCISLYVSPHLGGAVILLIGCLLQRAASHRSE